MNLLSFFKGFKDNGQLNRYKRLREVGRNLNNILVERLPKAAIQECGKKLGLLKGHTFVLGSEDELSVLFDYCLYNYRQGGKNSIERYLEHSPPPALSDEMILLQGMVNSYYSVFLVEDIQKGRGATLRDMLRDTTLSLLDIGIGKSGRPGMVFAGRVLPLADFHMTSGAFILLRRALVEKTVMPILKKFLPLKKPEGDFRFSPSQEASLSTQIIRAALRAGALDNMRYRDIES
jgi:hypothetical protein